MLRSQDDRRHNWRLRDRRVRRHVPYRRCLVILLAVSSFALLAHGTGKGTPIPASSAIRSPVSVQNQTGGFQEHAAAVGANGGMGAGNTSSERTPATAPAGTCWNPLDVTCWLQNAAQWIAQQIMNALQPVVTALLESPRSILTQTPAADTYSNATVIT